MEFRLWAPNAEHVRVVIDGHEHAMTAEQHGWWRADVPAQAGSAYQFRLDDGEPLPDPRSPHQPDGVTGPSQLIDHAAFPWTDSRWQAPPLAGGVIYELHVGAFTPAGTFDAAVERLDHLTDLGVTHVELMPLAQFSGRRNWGYDGVYPYAPHNAYGGPLALKRLVDACHARGLAVLLDVVYNHLGPEGNRLSRFGPYFTDRHKTVWGDTANLENPGSDHVRRFFIDNALMWIRDYHLDGLRVDAVHAFADNSARPFLEQLADQVHALAGPLNRHVLIIAESDLNDPRVVQCPDTGGCGFDAQWADDLHHALHALVTGERTGYYADFGRLADLAKALQNPFVYDGRYSAHRGRTHGRPPGSLSGHRFVVCLQNHDQIGNRDQGRRISHLADLGRVKAAAALILTSPYVPLIFQGEEWAATTPFAYFCDFQDPDLARDVRHGRKDEFASFGWSPDAVPDPQADQTFQNSKLHWDEPAREPHASMLQWYRQLIRLRRATPSLSDGRRDNVRARFDEDQRWLIMQRGPIAVACNFDQTTQQLSLDGHSQPLLQSDPAIRIDDGLVRLPPASVAVLRRS
ncbi:MAG: malto-oligosyltrehalose trehalohydrolase [Phycisphaerae bacterium]|nr:malto-oligosyltrehalose trehalohydrolase [Phycisphaerae bacterium]